MATIFEQAMLAGKQSFDRKEPITRKNFDNRALYYGKKIAGYQDTWPYLSRIIGMESTADETAWEAYFRLHLGGFPKCFELYRLGKMGSVNLPAARPEDFDLSYAPGDYLA